MLVKPKHGLYIQVLLSQKPIKLNRLGTTKKRTIFTFVIAHVKTIRREITSQTALIISNPAFIFWYFKGFQQHLIAALKIFKVSTSKKGIISISNPLSSFSSQ